MATGDKICPYCNQWQVWCKCGWAAARQREHWNDTAAPYTVDWVPPESVTARPIGGMYYSAPIYYSPSIITSIPTTTRKPRKRRHCRQVVY